MAKSAISWLSIWPLSLFKDRLRPSDDYEPIPDLAEPIHPLLKDHTSFQSYITTYSEYPSIRTFYYPHAHADKLKSIADLPLIVTIHGNGGSLPQFAPLLASFIHLAPSFGIELPGHGMSEFAPKNYEAYEFNALVELWKVAIEDICQRYGHHKVVLIGHSLGCSIAAALTSKSSKAQLDVEIVGMIAICPMSAPPTEQQVVKFRRLLALPNFILNIWRWYDRLGREKSNSVKRMVGSAAGKDLQRLQLRYNKQFKTPVMKRMALGCLPHYQQDGSAKGGMPGRSVWERVEVPLLLVSGESDVITKPKEAKNIVDFLQGKPASETTRLLSENEAEQNAQPRANDEQYGVEPSATESKTKFARAVKSVVLPPPASHALLYDHATYRTAAGLIEDFLAKHVSHELNLGWQLQQLTTSGKWDVKNLQKWKKVLPVSGPIDGGLFRALKTLREQDGEHTPLVFLQNWKDKIFALIDISHDSPVYDTKALERGGVEYHKFPTVSKIPPTVVEVQDFIALVDRLRAEIDEKHADCEDRPAIGVHCHYGYNRTGFFIVCYLIEKRGYRVQDAIEEFAKAKPPGIKHDHFIDTLFVRYCVGLKKSSTFK